jgi:hypothetical protein
MTYTHMGDVKHWQARAEELRMMAEQINDTKAREIMLRLVADYERLAEWAAGQAGNYGADSR